MIAIVDLELGNIGNVARAFDRLQTSTCITRDPGVLQAADGVVLPGVGNFDAASQALDRHRLRRPLIEAAARVPFLGICLGMQLLFERSQEGGRGLGLLPGNVVRLPDGAGPLPHIGWSSVTFDDGAGPFAPRRTRSADYYFCHSFVASLGNRAHAIATAAYGTQFTAAVRNGRMIGVQFHPEKSSQAGSEFLQAFVQEVLTCHFRSSPRSTSLTGAS